MGSPAPLLYPCCVGGSPGNCCGFYFWFLVLELAVVLHRLPTESSIHPWQQPARYNQSRVNVEPPCHIAVLVSWMCAACAGASAETPSRMMSIFVRRIGFCCLPGSPGGLRSVRQYDSFAGSGRPAHSLTGSGACRHADQMSMQSLPANSLARAFFGSLCWHVPGTVLLALGSTWP